MQRRAIVTGAASGIGRASAVELARLGYTLGLVDRDRGGLDALADELHGYSGAVEVFDLDIVDSRAVIEAFTEFASRWDGLDALVHSAGIMRAQSMDIREIDLEVWDQVLRVNLTGSFVAAQAAARIMIPQSAGVIILVGSGAGVSGPSGSIPYGASKGGVHGLALTLEAHLGRHGIRVHTVCPSAVDTPLLRSSFEEGARNAKSDESSYANAKSALVSPHEIGEVISLLAGPSGSGFKGTVFTR